MKKTLPRAEILAAARRFKEFHNIEAENVTVENLPTVAFALGNVLAITYEVIENGRKVAYHHEFERPPGLAITYDGRNSIILAGEWSFTKRGFEG